MRTKSLSAPLLLLPGLLCDATIWSEQIVDLADFAELRVVDYGGACSIHAMATCVLAQAPPCFSLAGHSMGARVALEVLQIAPERVERLALLDTGVHGVRPGEAEKRRALAEIGRREGMEALVDAWLPPMVHPERREDAAVMAPLREMCLRAGLATYEKQMEALLNRPDVQSLLPTIACATLIGVGAQDEWSPVEQHREIAAAIEGSELVVFEHSGHMAPFEAPGQVSDALCRWLRQPV